MNIALLLVTSWALSVSGLRCWTCENANSPRECYKQGFSKQCRFLERVCQTEVRFSVGWGQAPIIRTGCKEPHACTNNNVQNPRLAWKPTQCNPGKDNSVCRCCCASDHCNRKNLLCRPVMERASPLIEGPKDKPKPSSPPVRPEPKCRRYPQLPVNGRRLCRSGRLVGHTCTFSCNPGFKLVGSSSTICVRRGIIGRWNKETPTCEPNCDGLPKKPKDGMRECHGGGEIGTECSFVCDDGYELVGAAATSCEKNGTSAKWTHKTPECKPDEPPCPQLKELRHGNVTCTNTANGVGTKCSFHCSEEGYELLPSERLETECVVEGGVSRWDHRMPCCSTQCPPVAKKDIVIVLDSSRSINSTEWRIMKDFVADVIEKFKVSEDAVQFAVYRFYRRVDTESQILFGDYTNVDELSQAVRSLPKKGGGTHIGRALRHARDFVLKQGNRPDVADMVWVLTDGKSKDKFEEVATELRGQGVEIIALGVTRTGEEQFMKDLTTMTGDKDLVMEVKDVMKSFSNELVERVSGKICEVSCE